MNNKTRIIIGVVIAVLFVIGIVALVQTQPINSSEPTKITNQNDTQIQNNSTDTIEMESITIVNYALNKDKSSKVNTKPKSTIMDKSSKVNTKLNNSAKNEVVLINDTSKIFSDATLTEPVKNKAITTEPVKTKLNNKTRAN